jgi:hypothetical protein
MLRTSISLPCCCMTYPLQLTSQWLTLGLYTPCPLSPSSSQLDSGLLLGMAHVRQGMQRG